MTKSVHQAAAELLRSIEAPRGAVSVLAQPTTKGDRIRVLVERRYLRYVGRLPAKFRGYEVTVEERPEVVAC